VHVVFSHWSASWPTLGCYIVIAALHLGGLRRLLAGAGSGPGARDLRRQAFVFHGGLLLALVALVSPVGYLSDVYIWVRGLQFLLLALVAPGLIVLGAPWPALRAALRRPGSDGAASGASSGGRPPGSPRGASSGGRPPGSPRGASSGGRPPGSPRGAVPDRPGTHLVPLEGKLPGRPPWLLARPILAVVVVNLVWLAWQLPGPFDAAHGSSLIASAEHATCLLAGVVLWLQLIGSAPFSPPARALRRMELVVATVGAMTVLGMVLVFGSNVLYPVYANSAHHVMTVLDDQQLSGAVIWMGSLLPLITVAVALLMRWLSDEDSGELSADLDRLLLPRKNAWSARPGIR
jgi:cytochrome c oxidase assembly factor CtaG